MTPQSTMALHSRHLLDIENLPAEDIQLILDTSHQFAAILERPIKKVPTLRGRTVINAFFEPSTRTRVSFELAEKRLSADSVNFSTGGSSLSKGETLLDTAKTLEAMKPDILVVRHKAPGVPHFLAAHLDAAVINAGDGAHEHPTQALLDALTICRQKGSLEGLNVSIVGDIAHSRVARSNVFLLEKMGASVTLCAPTTLLPIQPQALGNPRVTTRIEEALEGADVVMMLRMQLERQGRGTFPSVREYFRRYALTLDRLSLANEGAIVMHPGPMNRGVEIASDVADGPFSVILEQVTNGVAVRMAVLYLTSGGSQEMSEAEAQEVRA